LTILGQSIAQNHSAPKNLKKYSPNSKAKARDFLSFTRDPWIDVIAI